MPARKNQTDEQPTEVVEERTETEETTTETTVEVEFDDDDELELKFDDEIENLDPDSDEFAAYAKQAGVTVDELKALVVTSKDTSDPGPPDVTSSDTAPVEGRWESYEAIRPTGARVRVTRNIDTGEHKVETIEV